MRLQDCSQEEATILIALAALAKVLPRSLIDYTQALGELSISFHGRGGRSRGDHNPSGMSLAQSRSIRATPRGM